MMDTFTDGSSKYKFLVSVVFGSFFFNNKEAKEALNRLETVQVFKGLKNYVFLQENIPLQEALDIRKRILIDKDTNFIRNFKSKCRSNELEMIFIQ